MIRALVIYLEINDQCSFKNEGSDGCSENEGDKKINLQQAWGRPRKTMCAEFMLPPAGGIPQTPSTKGRGV